MLQSESSETGGNFLVVEGWVLLTPTEEAIARVESGLRQDKKQRNVCFHGEKSKGQEN